MADFGGFSCCGAHDTSACFFLTREFFRSFPEVESHLRSVDASTKQNWKEALIEWCQRCNAVRLICTAAFELTRWSATRRPEENAAEHPEEQLLTDFQNFTTTCVALFSDSVKLFSIPAAFWKCSFLCELLSLFLWTAIVQNWRKNAKHDFIGSPSLEIGV